MKHRLATAFTAICLSTVLWIAPATPVSAGGVCAPYDVVVERLAAAYGEVPSLRGTTKSEHTVEVFSSQDFSTWTLTVRADGGPTCLIASGRGRDGLTAELAATS